MLVETRRALIKNAADAALVLDRALTKLLDEYDLYLQRYEVQEVSDAFQMKDVQDSIKELGTLPLQVANRLDDWMRDKQPELSFEGFELNVLNEFSLHLFALSTFFHRKYIEVEIDHTDIGEAFQTLRNVNRLLK